MVSQNKCMLISGNHMVILFFIYDLIKDYMLFLEDVCFFLENVCFSLENIFFSPEDIFYWG